MLHQSGFYGYTQSCKILLYAFLWNPLLILEAYSLVQGAVPGASAPPKRWLETVGFVFESHTWTTEQSSAAQGLSLLVFQMFM